MKYLFILLVSLLFLSVIHAQNQPGLHVEKNHTVLFGQDTISTGPKLMWQPSKGAFRVGNMTSAWNYNVLGNLSAAFGADTQAGGNYSIATGLGTWANSFTEFSIGRYSLGGGATTIWQESGADVVFEIGNGTGPSSAARSNMLTVQKNGNVKIGEMTDATEVIEEKLELDGGIVLSDAIDSTPKEGTIQYNTTTMDYEAWDSQNNEWKSLTSGPTNIGNYGTVVNPITGKVWLDRNLGASRVATSPTDVASYGDLYQWGRAAEGHQLRTSAVSTQQATTFIAESGSWTGMYILVFQWLSTAETHMWSGTEAENNPCPSGFRIPTNAEWAQERATWSSNDAAGAFASPLKLSKGGFRGGEFASFLGVGTSGYYWSSTANTDLFTSRHLFFSDSTAEMDNEIRGFGLCVRCIKD